MWFLKEKNKKIIISLNSENIKLVSPTFEWFTASKEELIELINGLTIDQIQILFDASNKIKITSFNGNICSLENNNIEFLDDTLSQEEFDIFVNGNLRKLPYIKKERLQTILHQLFGIITINYNQETLRNKAREIILKNRINNKHITPENNKTLQLHSTDFNLAENKQETKFNKNRDQNIGYLTDTPDISLDYSVVFNFENCESNKNNIVLEDIVDNNNLNNNSELDILGSIIIEIKIGTLVVNQEAIVIDNLCVPILLGLDFMDKTQTILNLKNNTITLSYNKESIILPLEYKNIKTDFNRKCIIDEIPELTEYKKFVLQNSERHQWECKYEEIIGNLLENSCEAIAHSVSQCLNMNKGIALLFRLKFPNVDILKAKKRG